MLTMSCFDTPARLLGRSLLLLILAAPAWAASNYTTPYSFTTLAGAINIGSADGTGAAARFNMPAGITADAAGNIYLADTGNNAIRRITPSGVVTTFAGSVGGVYEGSTDGTGTFARFNSPHGLALDPGGNLYVADTDNHTIRKITPAGIATTLAGTAGSSGSIDGAGAAARFNFPGGVAVDSAGNVYVADTDNSIIRRITPTGAVTTLAGTAGKIGSADGTGPAARFNYPTGVAVDATGNVYVADTANCTIRRITSDGVVSTLAGEAGLDGSLDGSGSAARFFYPISLTVGITGTLYVADSFNCTIRQITPAGVVSTLAGLAGYVDSTDGAGPAARFAFPFGIAVDAGGTLYVADTGNSTVRKITSLTNATTLAGASPADTSGSTDGTGAAARFRYMEGATVSPAGDVFVTDTANHTIRRITPAGIVTTFAGSAGTSGSAEGEGAAASFNYPSGLAADATGTLYVADSENHLIRKVSPARIVSTATTTTAFYYPYGVSVDSSGVFYVADTGNSTICKVTAAGVVTTLAGTVGASGSADGTGPAARFSFPQAVVADSAGYLYVADTGNSTIRRITPAGEVTTMAGLAGSTGSSDGSGSAARFDRPASLAIDADGNLFVADRGTHVIRKITPAGVVTTVAGSPDRPGSTDGIGWLARFSSPSAIALDAAGNLYVASGSTIRKGVAASAPVFTTHPLSQSVSAGSSVTLSGTAIGLPAPSFQWNLNGVAIAGATTNSLTLSGVQTSNAGDYTLSAINTAGTATSNKATLTVIAAPAPAPTPSAGGGGGGGASSAWFALALLALTILRRLTGGAWTGHP